MLKQKHQLDSASLKELRIKWAEECKYICPILNIDMKGFEVLDHWHISKSGNIDNTFYKGCCRGVIHRYVNTFEGKVLSGYIRSGLQNLIPLPTLLRNLADYYECNKLHTEDIVYIHPTEKPKTNALMKSSYQEVEKAIKGKKGKDKLPKYRNKQKLTKVLEELFNKYNLEPKFYK